MCVCFAGFTHVGRSGSRGTPRASACTFPCGRSSGRKTGRSSCPSPARYDCRNYEPKLIHRAEIPCFPRRAVGLWLHLLLCCVSQPGSSLEQTHIFVLAHILRRPIIVYGVKYYKSFRGETLGYTRFQGEPPVGRSSSQQR